MSVGLDMFWEAFGSRLTEEEVWTVNAGLRDFLGGATSGPSDAGCQASHAPGHSNEEAEWTTVHLSDPVSSRHETRRPSVLPKDPPNLIIQ